MSSCRVKAAPLFFLGATGLFLLSSRDFYQTQIIAVLLDLIQITWRENVTKSRIMLKEHVPSGDATWYILHNLHFVLELQQKFVQSTEAADKKDTAICIIIVTAVGFHARRFLLLKHQLS